MSKNDYAFLFFKKKDIIPVGSSRLTVTLVNAPYIWLVTLREKLIFNVQILSQQPNTPISSSLSCASSASSCASCASS